MIDLLKGSTLFPVCRTLSARNPILELSPGLKFRIHVYCDPNTKIDPNSFIRLKSASGKNSQIFQFAKSAEKRFKQNCEQFEVSCFDFAAKDIGSIGKIYSFFRFEFLFILFSWWYYLDKWIRNTMVLPSNSNSII